MKILHVITSLGGGGRERRMSQLVNYLYRNKISQAIALTGSRFARQDYEVPSSVEIFHAGGYGSRSALYKNLKQIIKSYKPNIVHVWTEVPIVLMSVSFLKLRFHFKFIVGFLADGNPVTSISCKLANKISYISGDAIISNSRAGLIAKQAPQEKSHVIYNGFDFSRINKFPFDEKSLRNELSVGDRKIISMCARFNRAKNWRMFLDIAEYFQEHHNETIIFLAVGSGEDFEAIKQESSNRNIKNISFVGQRRDVENIFKISYISLLLSNADVHAEGVSNSIMESMAIGCPVIATEGGGTQEIIRNEINGYVIKPNDLAEAVKLINRLINNEDLRDELGIKAQLDVKNKFNIMNMGSAYLKIYKDIIKNL